MTTPSPKHWPTPSAIANPLQRIRNWWQGYYAPPVVGDRESGTRSLCSCGHGVSLHGRKGCRGDARDQWLPMVNLPCRCRNSWRTVGRKFDE